MMKKSSKIALIIISLAISIALVLVIQTKKSLVSQDLTKKQPSPSPFSLLKTQEELKTNLDSFFASLNLEKEKEKNNLTEKLAAQIFQGFRDLNEKDFDPQQGLRAPTINEMEKQISQINTPTFFRDYYDFKDLKLVADSTENQKNYFIQLAKILKKYQLSSQDVLNKFSNFEETKNPDDLITLINQYHLPLLKEISQLPVPSSLADFQKKILNTLSAEKEIISSLANYQNDPLTSILALEAFLPLLNIQTELNQKLYQKLEFFNINL